MIIYLVIHFICSILSCFIIANNDKKLILIDFLLCVMIGPIGLFIFPENSFLEIKLWSKK